MFCNTRALQKSFSCARLKQYISNSVQQKQSDISQIVYSRNDPPQTVGKNPYFHFLFAN